VAVTGLNRAVPHATIRLDQPGCGWQWSAGMAISIVEVMSSRLSETKGEILIAGKGKYIGDVELSIAATCVDDLIAALNRARGAIGPSAGTPAEGVSSGPASPPVVKPGGQNGAAATAGGVKYEIPKKCSVIASRGGAKLVLLVFEGQSADQKAYALPAEAASKFAVGLARTSEALLREAGEQPR
jgi:hypothetical protein